MSPRGGAQRFGAALLLLATSGCAVGSFTSTAEIAPGVDGGRLVSDDGRVGLEVPPGALSEGESVELRPAATVSANERSTPYVVGPEGLELAAPARLTHRVPVPGAGATSGREGGAPLADAVEQPPQVLVTRGAGDELVPLPQQRIAFEGGGVATSGSISADGEVLAVPGPLIVSATPRHVVVPVGGSYTVVVQLRLPEDADGWQREWGRELLATAGPAGNALAAGAGTLVASYPILDEDGAEIGVEFVIVYTCAGPGRGGFGAGAAGLTLLAGTADCVSPDALAAQGDALPAGGAGGAGEDEDERWRDALLADGDSGAFEINDAGPAIGRALLEFADLPDVTAHVGDVFAVTLRARAPQMPEDQGIGLRVGPIVRPGAVIEAVPDHSESYVVLRRALGWGHGMIMFRCLRAGTQSYAASVRSDGPFRYEQAGGMTGLGPAFSIEEGDGTATCTARPASAIGTSGTDTQGVAAQAVAVNPGYAIDMTLKPRSFTARVDERVWIEGKIRMTVPRGYGQYVRIWPTLGPGDRLRISFPAQQYGNFIPGFPYGDISYSSWKLQCWEPGSQTYGVRFRVSPGAAVGDKRPGALDFTDEVTGTATCTERDAGVTDDDATGGGEKKVALGGDGVPDGFLAGGGDLGGGISVTTVVASSGLVGQTLHVPGRVAVDGLEPGQLALVLLEPRPGPGAALEIADAGPPMVLLVPAGAAADFALPVTCAAEGVQAAGVRVFVAGARYDASGAVVGEAEPVAETRYTSLVRCAEDPADAGPIGFGLAGVAGIDAPDGATLGPTLEGPCDGRADIAGYGTVDPSASGGVYTVPRIGSASYHGAIEAVPGEPRSHNGSVVVNLPLGLTAPVAQWRGETDEVSRAGGWSWDLAGWVPGGALLPVSGTHVDTAGVCTATVMVRFDGGFTDSPVGPAAAAMALLSLAGLAWAGLPKS